MTTPDHKAALKWSTEIHNGAATKELDNLAACYLDALKQIEELTSELQRIHDAANNLVDWSEEYEFADGPGRGAQQEAWDGLIQLLDQYKEQINEES